jgi:hypothetical protein
VLAIIIALLVLGARFGKKSPSYKNWPRALSRNPAGLLEALLKIRVK